MTRTQKEFEVEFVGFDKYKMKFVAVNEKVFEEFDERGEKVVTVKGGVRLGCTFYVP